jgi:hypothetical protein
LSRKGTKFGNSFFLPLRSILRLRILTSVISVPSVVNHSTPLHCGRVTTSPPAPRTRGR